MRSAAFFGLALLALAFAIGATASDMYKVKRGATSTTYAMDGHMTMWKVCAEAPGLTGEICKDLKPSDFNCDVEATQLKAARACSIIACVACLFAMIVGGIDYFNTVGHVRFLPAMIASAFVVMAAAGGAAAALFALLNGKNCGQDKSAVEQHGASYGPAAFLALVVAGLGMVMMCAPALVPHHQATVRVAVATEDQRPMMQDADRVVHREFHHPVVNAIPLQHGANDVYGA